MHLAAMPYLGFTRHHIRSDTCERDRKLLEIGRILISDGQRTDEIADILSEYISRRQASDEVLLKEVRAAIVVRTDVEHLVLMHRIIAVFVHHLHPVVVLLIVERDGQHVFLLVFGIRI